MHRFGGLACGRRWCVLVVIIGARVFCVGTPTHRWADPPPPSPGVSRRKLALRTARTIALSGRGIADPLGSFVSLHLHPLNQTKQVRPPRVPCNHAQTVSIVVVAAAVTHRTASAARPWIQDRASPARSSMAARKSGGTGLSSSASDNISGTGGNIESTSRGT